MSGHGSVRLANAWDRRVENDPESIFSLKVGRYNPDCINLIEVLELVHRPQHCIKDLPDCLKVHGQLIKGLEEAIPSDAEWDQLSAFIHAL